VVQEKQVNHLISVIVPRKGLVISTLEDFSEYIVRDGIVIDKDYMNLLPREQKEAVSTSKNELVLYMSLQKVPKDPTTVITRDSSTSPGKTRRNDKDVLFHIMLSIIQNLFILKHLI